jgi:hypothetical protein
MWSDTIQKDPYPHLCVALDKDPFFVDLWYQAEHAKSMRERICIREEIEHRFENITQWLTRHGYRCGADYFEYRDSYRFANNGLATAFALVWTK